MLIRTKRGDSYPHVSMYNPGIIKPTFIQMLSSLFSHSQTQLIYMKTISEDLRLRYDNND